MDYSLQNLNRIGKLNNLTFQDFVEKLNLIGLEVDKITYEKVSTNRSFDNIQVSLKIPANREDLLNEIFFVKELSAIFLFSLFEIWENVKQKYSFLLKQKYTYYNDYSVVYIHSQKKNVVTYLLKVENVDLSPSPLWLTEKLLSLNLTSTNILNDIFALVFYEWGQNINLLKRQYLSDEDSENIELTCLEKNESFFNSDQNQLLLYPGTIALKLKKENEIISFVGNQKKNIEEVFLKENQNLPSFFLEGTFYDIHKNQLFLSTAKTKISLKYLRQCFLKNFKYSFQRILTLLEILTSCTISNVVYRTLEEKCDLDTTKILKVKKQSFLDFLQISSPESIIFQKASLQIVCETKKEYYFKIPVHRQDLLREVDILEEYSRFIGYKNFQEISPFKSVIYRKSLFRSKNFVKNFFLSYGFNEVITNPINDYVNKNDFSVVINNPLNTELSTLRRSLIPKLLTVFEANSRSYYSRKNFFEIGRTFKQINGKVIEEDKLSGIFQISTNKNFKKNFSDWFSAKGFIESFLFNFGYQDIEIQNVKKSIRYFHPKRSVMLISGKKVIGIFGEINPILFQETYSHVQGSVYLFEFNMNYLKEWQLTKKVSLFKESSKYPSITKDLSLTINKEVNFNSLKSFLLLQSVFLKQVVIFDIYYDENFINKINIGIRFEFQSTTETLTNEFIEIELEKIKLLILKKYDLTIRI
jgi:phenylalanyl-tRNA synthetase beta chain